MSKRSTAGLLVAGIMLTVLVGGILTAGFVTNYDQPQELEVFEPLDDSGEIKEDSLSYVIFEKYGFALIPLAILMFGAMVGGVVISKEEVEE